MFGPNKQHYFESVACLDLVLPNHSAETVRVSAPLVLGCQRPSSRTGHHALWNCTGAGGVSAGRTLDRKTRRTTDAGSSPRRD